MNKLRYILIGIMLSYCGFLIYSMVSTYIYSSNEISVDIDANYYNLVGILEKKIEGIKEDDLTKKSKVCFGLIKNIKSQSVKNITKTIDKAYITKMLDPKTTVAPSYYLEVWQSCELSEENKSMLSPLMLTSMTGNVATEQKIISGYEFRLENKKFKQTLEADVTDLTYSYTKNSEILTAIYLINTLRYEGEETNNE